MSAVQINPIAIFDADKLSRDEKMMATLVKL